MPMLGVNSGTSSLQYMAGLLNTVRMILINMLQQLNKCFLPIAVFIKADCLLGVVALGATTPNKYRLSDFEKNTRYLGPTFNINF